MRSNKDILRSKDSEAYIDEHEYDGSVESIYDAMDEARKETSIGLLNWMKSQGVNWNVRNASTPAEELYKLFLKTIEQK